MKTSNEIRNALENIKYYAGRINALVKEQTVIDAGLEDINSQVGSTRFDAIGAIGSCCSWLDTYCSSIEINLNTAEKQDKLLQSEELE